MNINLNKFSKSEVKKIRELAALAWERELRAELNKLRAIFAEMDEGLCPFQVNEEIDSFHNGVSRELFKRYSDTDPFFAVCRARFKNILTDEDLADTSDAVRDRIEEMVDVVGGRIEY
ncbi:MAG: hypothetical protein ACI9G1_003485 [Pirellulaceae bacterium]|jgi:hypothetical protein